MAAFIKLQRKGQMVIPRSLREEVGVAEGTLMKVDVIKGSQFLVTPQFTIDRPALHGHKTRNQALRELAVAMDELRQHAKKKGLDKMPMSEINRIVATVRRDMRKKSSKHPVK